MNWPESWGLNKTPIMGFFDTLQKLDLYESKWNKHRLALELVSNLFSKTVNDE